MRADAATHSYAVDLVLANVGTPVEREGKVIGSNRGDSLRRPVPLTFGHANTRHLCIRVAKTSREQSTQADELNN